MGQLNKLFNKYNKMVGVIGAESYFDIYRPNYAAANQTGTLIASNKSCRIDTRAQAFAEPSLQGGMYFDVFLDRSIVQAGDILIPTGLSPTASGYFEDSEILTICSISGLKPCVGMITDCLGKITDDVNTTLYNNVRFQWCSPGQPVPTANNRAIADAFPYDRRKALMYRRQGQGLPTPLMKDQRLVEIIDGLESWWRIVDVMSISNFTMLQVMEDNT